MSDERETSKKILDRVQAESETVGTSAMLRSADATLKDIPEPTDEKMARIDALGTKIGRTLGRIAFVVLAGYLIFTYVIPIG